MVVKIVDVQGQDHYESRLEKGGRMKDQTKAAEEEIKRTAWNQAIEAALLTIPGGSMCDPQDVADEIRRLMLQTSNPTEATRKP